MRQLLAAETPGGWEPGPGDAAELRTLRAAVAAVVARDVVALPEPSLKAEMEAVQEVRRRLEARAAKVTAEITKRRADRARRARPDNPRAGEQAARQVRQEMVGEFQMTHAEAKRAQQTGRNLADAPTARAAYDEGRLTPRKAAVLADMLKFVDDPDEHARLERELTADGQKMNDVDFGKRVRRRLAEYGREAAGDEMARRHQQRTGRLALSPEGFQELAARIAGLGGETVATAVHAYRRPDAPGEHRTSEQATADAVVAMAEAALAAGKAPRQHGVRPHLIIMVSDEAVRTGTGVAETFWSGPVPVGEVEQVFDDCDVSRLVRDARGVPVEASEAVRNVPVGVWRAVLERDRGCIADGCDHPPMWCQVMHLGTPYRFDGRLTIQTAGLGCSYHHKKFDNHGWQVTWFDGRPVIHHPDKPPRGPTARGDPP